MELNLEVFPKTVEQLAEFSGVPVWNGLTDDWHPTQMLADYMTIKRKFWIFKRHQPNLCRKRT